MIVRDGAATLPACLQSAAGICDELIVVDTGSRDASPDIARAFGARVLHLQWPNDFSAARNVYLEHARCPWVLSLDADETLGTVSRDDVLGALAAHPTSAFLFNIRNDFPAGDLPEPTLPSRVRRDRPGAPGYIVTRTIRLFPRLEGIRYRFPVHESLLPAIRHAGLRVQQCAIPIRHAGYLNRPQDPGAKIAMYRALGERKIAAFPNYFPGYVELGQLYLHAGEFTEAARLFAHAIRLSARCVEAHYFLAVALLRLERYAECGRLLRAARVRFPFNADIRHVAERFRRQTATA
jgi:glycosyltransferase involved in cell wall biosynthesis